MRLIVLAALGLTFLATASCKKTPMQQCLAHDLTKCEEICLAPPPQPSVDGPLACQGAATQYTKGNPPNWTRYAMMLDRACDMKASDVCVSLGVRYREGMDLPKDPVKARTYFTKGCDQQYQPACDDLKKLASSP